MQKVTSRNMKGLCCARKLLSRTALWQSFCTKRYLLISRSGQYDKSMTQVREALHAVVGAPSKWGTDPAQKTTMEVPPLAKSQADLPARRMLDSYQEAIIPLGSMPNIRQKYVNHFNTVRIGRLLEDLDTMAGCITFRHHLGSDLSKRCGFAAVTALVDSIQLNSESICSDSDLLLRGHPTWVGNTSIEITMDVDQEIDGAWKKMLTAKFLMVTSNPTGKEKAFLCPLEAVTGEEKALIAQGEASKKKRQLEQKESLLKTPPTEEEREHIHALFTKTLDPKAATFKRPVKPDGSVWMEHTLLKNVHVCFPQDRNLYNKIFGGFLMRESFELAWANACLHCKSRPMAVAVDDIMFRKPVEVGSLLFMSSQIVYTEGPYMQLKVHAEVVNAVTGAHDTTNIFHYTFKCQQGDVPEVTPKSYAEYMMFIDGQRHFKSNQTTD